VSRFWRIDRRQRVERSIGNRNDARMNPWCDQRIGCRQICRPHGPAGLKNLKIQGPLGLRVRQVQPVQPARPGRPGRPGARAPKAPLGLLALKARLAPRARKVPPARPAPVVRVRKRSR
jgi:hypothetical protein